MEGKRSLQDRPKPLHYAENRQRFARFASKIIHVTLDEDPQDKARYRCFTCGTELCPAPEPPAAVQSTCTGAACALVVCWVPLYHARLYY